MVNDPQPPVLVPIDAVSSETLDAIVESFIMREGTDYGRNEIEMETKIKQVLGQLRKGDVKLVYDPQTESVTLLTNNQWKKLNQPLA